MSRRSLEAESAGARLKQNNNCMSKVPCDAK